MTGQRIGVGIVGFKPETSWAAKAHVPALRALADDFAIVGVANSHIASSRRAAEALGVPAFADAHELIAAPEVDVVVVTVRVPYHHAVVKAAIEAGKHVYCEWPLGNGLAEAEDLAAIARAKGVIGVVGTQARLAPEVQYLKALLAEGYVGKVVSTTLIGRGGQWGGTIADEAGFGYLMDNANGATMLTIPLGHTLAALTDVLGGVGPVSARLATRYEEARVLDTGGSVPVTAPDQVLVSGVFQSGAPLSIHYHGGMPREGGLGLLWAINGTEGDLQITGPFGHSQLVPLALAGGRGGDAIRPIAVPAALREGFPEDAVSGNVARVYAQMAADIREGTRTAPTFDDAVAIHRIIAAIEAAAA